MNLLQRTIEVIGLYSVFVSVVHGKTDSLADSCALVSLAALAVQAAHAGDKAEQAWQEAVVNRSSAIPDR